jgi:hypothetical protein
MASTITTTATALAATLAAVSTVAAPIMTAMTAGPSKIQSYRPSHSQSAGEPAYRTSVQAEAAYRCQAEAESGYGAADTAGRGQPPGQAADKAQAEPAYRQILPKSGAKSNLLAEPTVRPLQVSTGFLATFPPFVSTEQTLKG